MLAQRLGIPFPDDVFVPVNFDHLDSPVQLKIEGLNPAGSIKIKTAFAVLEGLHRSGRINRETTVVESSSGNLGLALSILCAALGIRFVCVCDANTLPETRDLIRFYGAEVEVIEKPDSNGGFLGSRLERVKQLTQDGQCVWTDQYSNPAAKWAHHRWTAPAILNRMPDLEYLFVGVGTGGTSMGCAEYLRAHAPHVRVIGVDSVGSITFGHPPSRRHLPGLGMSQNPPLFDRHLLDDAILVPEAEAVATCWSFRKRHGFTIGASTGTVLAGIQRYAKQLSSKAVVAAISPDLGERYQSTVYDKSWALARYPDLGELE